MADIDKLNIQIVAETSKAVNSINNTIDSLTRLDSAISKINFSKIGASFNTDNIKTASKSINSLKNAANKLGNLDISSFVNNFNNLNNIVDNFNISSTAVTDMKGFASGVTKMVNASTKLNKEIDYTTLTKNINKLVTAIRPLTDEMIRAGSGMSNYGEQMKMLAQAARTANATTERAANKGGFYGSGKTFFKLSNFSMLLNASRQVGRALANSIADINTYVENMNLFTVAMGEFATEAQAFAEKMEIKLGIDSGEAMRYMGVFQQLSTSFGVAGEQAYVLSKNLTQLGYDLASFFNLKTDEAFLKLQSGIAGEIEPLTLAA